MIDISETIPHLRGNFEGMESSLMIVEMSRDHQFVGMDFLDDLPKRALNGFSRTDGGIGEGLPNLAHLEVGGVAGDVIDGCGNWPRRTASKINERLLHRSKLAARFLVSVGGKNIHADHGIGLLKLPGRFKLAPINLKSLYEIGWSKMGSEREGKPQQGGQLRAKQA